MAIVPIPNQPINLQPPTVDPCNIGDNKEYCTLYQTDGVGYVQFRQTPCDGNIISEGNFATVDDWTADAGWDYLPNSQGASLSDGSYRHVPGTTDDLVQTVTAVNGKYCKVTFTVSNRTAGEMEVFIGGTSAGTIDENGTFSLYAVAGVTGELKFTADSELDGTISYVSLFILQNSFTATLLNEDDASASAFQPSFSYNYNKDFVTVQWSWQDVPEGCYKVSIGDPCDPGTSSEILLNPSFTSLSNWTIVDNNIGSTQCLSISGGNLNVTKVVSGIVENISEYAYQPIAFTPGNCYYRFSVTFGAVDDTFISATDTLITILLTDGSAYPFTDITFSQFVPQANTTVYFDWYGNLTNYDDPTFVIFVESNGTGGGTGGEYMEIASASLQSIYDCADSSETLVSNCLAISTEHDCAKRVIGDCYSGSDVVKYGFMFDGTFRLDQMARFLKFNPFYPTDADDYEYSSGTRSLTFAKREKYWEGLLDYADENFHDTVSTQVLCDTIQIDGVSYFVRPGDYKPEWDKDGRQRLAQARIELRKKSSTIQSN
jgi:hypothetical protein